MAKTSTTRKSAYQKRLEQLERITPADFFQDSWRKKATVLLQQLAKDVANYKVTTVDLLDLVERLFTKSNFRGVKEIVIFAYVSSNAALAQKTILDRCRVGNDASGYWDVQVFCVGRNLVIFVTEALT